MSDSARDRDIFASYDYKETEEYRRHERVMQKVREMSTEEKLQSLIEVGIVDEQGRLTKRYGGEAPNPGE